MISLLSLDSLNSLCRGFFLRRGLASQQVTLKFFHLIWSPLEWILWVRTVHRLFVASSLSVASRLRWKSLKRLSPFLSATGPPAAVWSWSAARGNRLVVSKSSAVPAETRDEERCVALTMWCVCRCWLQLHRAKSRVEWQNGVDPPLFPCGRVEFTPVSHNDAPIALPSFQPSVRSGRRPPQPCSHPPPYSNQCSGIISRLTAKVQKKVWRPSRKRTMPSSMVQSFCPSFTAFTEMLSFVDTIFQIEPSQRPGRAIPSWP